MKLLNRGNLVDMINNLFIEKILSSCKFRRLKSYLWDILVNAVLSSYLVPTLIRKLMLKMLGMKAYGIIHAHCYIGSNRLQIDKGSYINRGCIVDNENADVYIGKNCSIGFNVMFLTTNHDISNSEKRGGIVRAKPIRVENGVWIGAGAKIMPGICIKQGAVIASGSIVTKNVPANCIYAGVPGKKIKDCEV